MPTNCFEPVRRDVKAKISTSPHPGFQRFGEPRKFLPVCLVQFVLVTLWFTYHDSHCMPLLDQDDTFHRGWLDVIIFNVLFMMVYVCYARAVLQHPGTIPDSNEDGVSWERAPRDARLGKNQDGAPEATETKKQGDRRNCKWCNKFKPDRTHHCRVCRLCILKMDHHCPWIYNCVGFKNYKFFFLLCLYAVAGTQFMVWTMLENVASAWTDERMPFLRVFSILFGVTLAGFFAGLLTLFVSFHICLSLKGMSTIEYCEQKGTGRPTDTYSLGCYGNICAILGDNPLLWLLPMSSPSGTGLSFKNKTDIEDEQQEAAKAKAKAYGTMNTGSCCVSGGSHDAGGGTGGTSSGNEGARRIY